MAAKAIVALGFIVIFLLAARLGHAEASYFIVHGKVHTKVDPPGHGCWRRLGQFFKRLVKRYEPTHVQLFADRTCFLTWTSIARRWGCQQDLDQPTNQPAMVVTEDKRRGKLSGLLKMHEKVRPTDVALLEIQPYGDVEVDCGRCRCTFTHEGEDGTYHLRLFASSFVQATLHADDQVIIPLRTKMEHRASRPYHPILTLKMTTRAFVPVFKLTREEERFTVDSNRQWTVAGVLDEHSIAMTLEHTALGLTTLFTFVRKGHKLPLGTIGAVIEEDLSRRLTKRFLRAEAAIRPLRGETLLGTVSLAPVWAALRRATEQNVCAPQKQIKALVFQYEGGRFGSHSLEEVAAQINLFSRPYVLVLCTTIELDVMAAARRLNAKVYVTVADIKYPLRTMAAFSARRGFAPSQILYKGASDDVGKSDFAVAVCTT